MNSEEEHPDHFPMKPVFPKCINLFFKLLKTRRQESGSKKAGTFSKQKNMKAIGYKTLAPVSFSTLKVNDQQVRNFKKINSNRKAEWGQPGEE